LLKAFLTFLTCIFELYNLEVLRVLSKQTLEISKEVRDSSIPDPSLAKVVKDSTITILLVLDQFCSSDLWKQGHSFGGFCRTGAHCLGEKSSLGLEDLGYGVYLIQELFTITRAPFLISLGRFITAYLFITEVR
jgi:hypothetical protein